MDRIYMTMKCTSIWCVLVLTGCSLPEGEKAEGHNQGVRPPVAVEVAKALAMDVHDSIDVVGSLAPKLQSDVKSEYSGVITDLYVTEWVRVEKGDPLARLDTREAGAAVEAAKAAYVQAEVAENKAGREYERALKLKEGGLITQQSLDDALTARNAAAAATNSAKAQLEMAETRLAKAVIRAPMDGVVAFRGVNVGDYVENMGSHQPMFRIVDNRVLDLTVTVPSVHMSAVRTGQAIIFSTDVFPGKDFMGQIKYINPAVDEMSRSVKVIAEVPNDTEELRGGIFVKGRIITGTRKGVLVIPRTALINWDLKRNQAEVFTVQVQQAAGRTVHTGGVSGDLVEIVSGLVEGDTVITRGAFNVREGDRLNVKLPEGA